MAFAWGNKETQYFFELTPDRILDAVESSGLRCTGRCLTLNSMENRVYEVEIEMDPAEVKIPSDRFRIVKFYRPGRWSAEQIQEEHTFLFDLQAAEIPAVAPIRFPDGSSFKQVENMDIRFALFPKAGGRSPDELLGENLDQVGRLLARLHAVGKTKTAPHRLRLDVDTYARANLEFLLQSKSISKDQEARYAQVVEKIIRQIDPWFKSVTFQRIHGDCHLGNLLLGSQGLFFVDFDDMLSGPPVQDFWLLVPGRDEESAARLNRLIAAYETFFPFDWDSLRLIEPLRALRFIHFSAWIAKRHADPAFQRVFSDFGTPRYWEEQTADLQEQWERCQNL